MFDSGMTADTLRACLAATDPVDLLGMRVGIFAPQRFAAMTARFWLVGAELTHLIRWLGLPTTPLVSGLSAAFLATGQLAFFLALAARFVTRRWL